MKDLILETANRLFTRRGIQAFTMDDIASQMAISKKTIYRFYTTRHELVQEVCKALVQDFTEAIARTDAETAGQTLKRLLGYMGVTLRFCKKIDPAFFTDLQKHYPLQAAFLTDTLQGIIQQRMEKLLEQGIGEGVFRGSLHPRLVVAILLQHVQKDFEFAADLVNEYAKDEVFRQAMYMFLYGIIAPDAIARLEEELMHFGSSDGKEQPASPNLYN